MIEVQDLLKTYGALRAVDGVCFRVRAGEIYGLLGPNGAGKTTTISCVCGLIRPDAGRVVVAGSDLSADPIAVRSALGVVPQETALYDTLSAHENVEYFASLYGLSGGDRAARVTEALERVGLSDDSKKASRKFSGGMKRRLNLAMGIVHRPKAILLDEPTVGIDPQARIHILDVVRKIKTEGTAILYTTHYLEEAESLCDRIGIMDHGRILAEGTVAELRRMVGAGTVVTLKGEFTADRLAQAAGTREGVKVISAEDGLAMLSVDGGQRDASELLSSILRGGVTVSEISMQEPSLQSVFIKLTGRELRD